MDLHRLVIGIEAEVVQGSKEEVFHHKPYINPPTTTSPARAYAMRAREDQEGIFSL